VGSGAGAQARAVDCHAILRPHAEKDVHVLEAALRSFPPLEPVCLRWEFPIWKPAEGLDPTRLADKVAREEAKAAARQRQDDSDDGKLLEAITKIHGRGQPATLKQARTEAALSHDRATRAARRLVERFCIEEYPAEVPPQGLPRGRGGRWREWREYPAVLTGNPPIRPQT
jgi:hypothetical protein